MTPLQALSVNTPAMAPLFGWTELAETDGLAPQLEAAETATTQAIAHAYEGLDASERDELVRLVGELHTATS